MLKDGVLQKMDKFFINGDLFCCRREKVRKQLEILGYKPEFSTQNAHNVAEPCHWYKMTNELVAILSALLLREIVWAPQK